MAKLLVVATPIGNIGDLSENARNALEQADLIAAEDTRVTAALLSVLGLQKRLFPYHRHNERQQAETLAAKIFGEDLTAVIVCDAGTPGISDPAAELVARCVETGVDVRPIPGPSAVAAALSVCGFTGADFAFRGFLPRESGPRAKALSEIAQNPVKTCVFFESPRRIRATIQSFAETLPKAKLCLCHELTKTFEWIQRGTPAELTAFLNENPDAEKGEYVLVAELSQCETESAIASDPYGLVAKALIDGFSEKEAVARAVAAGVARNAAYKAMVELTKWRDAE